MVTLLRRKKRLAILITAIALISAVVGWYWWPRGRPRVVEGLYWGGFEASDFKPCGSTQSWWLSSTHEFGKQYFALLAQQGLEEQPIAIYVKVRGVPSRRGHFGHLGGYEREFEVIEVLEMRWPRVNDCD